jgi:hypothetical protein
MQFSERLRASWSAVVLLVLLTACGLDDPATPPPPPAPPAPPPPTVSFTTLANATEGLTAASLIAAFRDAAGTTWVGSSQGTVLSRTGGTWRLELLRIGLLVTGLWAAPGEPVRAVAGGEAFIRRNGTWEEDPVPQTGALFLEIWGLDADHAWILGTGGTILRRVPNGWSQAVTSVTEEVWGVAGDALDALVAVGQNGLILESSDSGATWLQRASPTTRTLFAVASDGNGRMVAVGSGGTILVRENGTWQAVQSPTFQTLFEVRASGPGEFVVAGDGGVILRGDGTNWTPVAVKGARENLRAIVGSPGQRTAVGWYGTILTESTGWDSELAGGRLYGIHVAPDGVALAVGTGGLAYERRGGTWRTLAIPTPASLFAVDGPSSGDRLAVGDSGTIMQEVGGIWTREPIVSGVLLRSVWYDGTHALAVGSGGVALVRENGTWRNVPTGTTRFLRHVNGTRWGRLYVVGDSGTAMIWNGQTFANVAVPTANTLRGVHATSDRDVWMVGDVGTIIRGDGTSWTKLFPPTLNDLRAVRRLGDKTYIVGEFGQAFRFEADAWTQMGTAQGGFWLGLDGDSELVAVGEIGIVAEGRP